MLPASVDADSLTLASFGAVLAMSAVIAWMTAGHERVPIHFGLTLKPDNFGPRWAAISAIPALQVFLFVLFRVIMHERGGQRGVGTGCLVGQALYLTVLARWRRSV